MYLINYYLIKYSVTQFIGQGRTFKDFNNKMNKHKRKAAAPRGRLAHTKPQNKVQAGSSLVWHCGHSLTLTPPALGPAPLVTHTFLNKNKKYYYWNISLK